MTEDEKLAKELGLTVEEMYEADRIYAEGLANMIDARGAIVHLELTFKDGKAYCSGMTIHPMGDIFLTKDEVEMVGRFVGLDE